jgi:TolA-binding protein/predicted negative regulator of RcsB-dependent stress response
VLRRFLSLFVLFLGLVVFSGCSTKKNTLLSRSYHQLTSRYNTFFNGNESFKRGVNRINKQYEYDFTRNLPVFTYTNPELAKSASADMDRAITKASKIITTKSITTKPDKPKGQPSQKETDFYNQREFNLWVVESYLLMGKAHFYKHDYPSAVKTFQFMQNEFPENLTVWPAKIWLARAYLETGRTRDAKILLDKLSLEGGFPPALKSDLDATFADYYLKQNELSSAIPYLQRALNKTRDKNIKTRYTYLLAQLYAKTNDPVKSNEYFSRVLKLNPPYEMVFNAKINLALSPVSTDSGDEKITADLKKMLKDEKNRDYEDQIYFTLGNISLRNGKEAEAMDYFQKSSEAGDLNSPQKVVTNLTLAEIALKKPDYVKASDHYAKAAAIIKSDYPGYESIMAKSKNLGNLAINIRSFQLEDSVQVLAKMNENDRNQVIDQIIAKIKQAEADERMAEAALRREQQERYMRTAPVSQMQAGRSESSVWYFYNQQTVNFGIAEFEALWGKRRLEDNWRRSSRQILTQDQTGDLGTTPLQEQAMEGESTTSPTSREYYMKNIPLTPEQLEISHNSIEEALFNMGKIFKNDIKDYKQATWSLEELNRRYPEHDRMAEALYDLHETNLLTGSFSRAEHYKNQVVQRFPQTVYANILLNPNYYRELQEQEIRIEKLYQETFTLYEKKQYAEVVRNSTNAINTYPETNLLPKFMFIRAISNSSLGNTALFRVQLLEIIEKYPDSDVKVSSEKLLALLDTEQPEFAEKELVEEAKEIYGEQIEGLHYVIFAVKNDLTAINQLVFNLINFNIDFFNRLNLQVITEELSQEKKLLKITSFKDRAAATDYYVAALGNNELTKDVPEDSFTIFFISETNLKVLLNDKSVEKYLKFFDVQILKKE